MLSVSAQLVLCTHIFICQKWKIFQWCLMLMIVYLSFITCTIETIESLLCHYRLSPLPWALNPLLTHSHCHLNHEVRIWVFCWWYYLYCHDHTFWKLPSIIRSVMFYRMKMKSLFLKLLLKCWVFFSFIYLSDKGKLIKLVFYFFCYKNSFYLMLLLENVIKNF